MSDQKKDTNFNFRPLTESDRPQLEAWRQGDSEHKDYSSEYFFVPNTNSFMFEDETGPVFAARIAPILRIGVQFSHDKDDRKGRFRTAKMLKLFLVWLEEQARKQKFSELIYSSASKDLIKFCERFGYWRSDIEYRKRLYTTDTGNTPIIPTSEDADARSTQ